jgi:hypothetical protein
MSIETPKPSSENKLREDAATPEELRDIWHLDTPDESATDSQDTAATNADDSNETGETKKRKAPASERFLGSRGRQLGALILAGGAAIGIPTVIANNIAGNTPHDADQNTTGPATAGTEVSTQPTVSTEASSSASPTNLTPLETAKPTAETTKNPTGTLELSVEKYPDVQSLAKGIMSERWTAWENQGATQENRDKFMSPTANKSAGEFAAEKAKANADIFPKAIFVEGYKTNANLVKIAERVTEINTFTLERTLITWDDTTPYERKMDIVGKAELLGGSVEEKMVSFKVNWINTSNAEDNRIGTEYDPNDVNPVTGTYTITAVITDGEWKIANIQW